LLQSIDGTMLSELQGWKMQDMKMWNKTAGMEFKLYGGYRLAPK